MAHLAAAMYVYFLPLPLLIIACLIGFSLSCRDKLRIRKFVREELAKGTLFPIIGALYDEHFHSLPTSAERAAEKFSMDLNMADTMIRIELTRRGRNPKMRRQIHTFVDEELANGTLFPLSEPAHDRMGDLIFVGSAVRASERFGIRERDAQKKIIADLKKRGLDENGNPIK